MSLMFLIQTGVSFKDWFIVFWITFYELFILNLFRPISDNGMCKSKAKLNGKTAIITGSNTGIGKETAKELAKRGARIIMACRNIKEGIKAADEIKQTTENDNVVVKVLDLASFKSIRNFADNINSYEERIDILVNNAGVFLCPQSKTEDGFEMHFGVNYLGHFLLTLLLVKKIKKSSPARIINLTSNLHRSNNTSN